MLIDEINSSVPVLESWITSIRTEINFIIFHKVVADKFFSVTTIAEIVRSTFNIFIVEIDSTVVKSFGKRVTVSLYFPLWIGG